MGDVTVEPLLGLVTVTVAKAGAASDRPKQTREWTILIAAFCISCWRAKPRQGRPEADSPLLCGRSKMGDRSGERYIQRPQSSAPLGWIQCFARHQHEDC